MYKLSITLVIILTSLSNLFSQIVIDAPVAMEKSHANLKVISVEINNDATIFCLSIENQRDDGGWFCASKNIALADVGTSEVYNLLKSEGIPTCPENYAFKSKGEVLFFKLFFPPIPPDTKKIDLVENCDQACFFFRNLILDKKLIKHIRLFEKGVEYVTNEEYIEAIKQFSEVAECEIDNELNIYGLSYYYIILSYHELGENKMEVEWCNKLKNSVVPDKSTILFRLKELKIIEE